jgi:hypothetical protein
MTRKKLALPPVPPKALLRQRAILGALVRRAIFAYAGYGTVMAFLAVTIVRVLQGGSVLEIGFLTAGLLGVYVLTGGALCGAFIGQLRNWPPPGPNCVIHGRHFVRTWPWTAARILTQLAMRDVMGG